MFSWFFVASVLLSLIRRMRYILHAYERAFALNLIFCVMHINKAHFIHMQKHLSVRCMFFFSSYHISYFMRGLCFSIHFFSSTFFHFFLLSSACECVFFIQSTAFEFFEANKSFACELSFTNTHTKEVNKNVLFTYFKLLIFNFMYLNYENLPHVMILMFY